MRNLGNIQTQGHAIRLACRLFAVGLALSIGLAGCGGAASTAGNGATTGNGGSSSATGLTPKGADGKPAQPPAISVETCAKYLSIAEASQDTGFTVTQISVTPEPGEGGACSYDVQPGQPAVTLVFTPGSDAILKSNIDVQTSAGVTATPVSGIGDKAYALIDRGAGGGSETQYHLTFLEGFVMVDVVNLDFYTTPGGDSGGLAMVTKVAQTVETRLATL